MGTRSAAGILAAARQRGVTPTGLLLSIDTTPEPLGTPLPAPPAHRSGLRSAANPSSLTAPPRSELGETPAVPPSPPHHPSPDAAAPRSPPPPRRPRPARAAAPRTDVRPPPRPRRPPH